MKKLIFGIFAHPDDEAFGPSATFMKEVDQGAELYLICATRGECGANIDQYVDLATVRQKEWERACDLIGAKGRTCLDFGDGALCNNLYHRLSASIEESIRDVCESEMAAFEICLVTYGMDGLTGHLDHIAVSSATTAAFYRLCKRPPLRAKVKELAYFCLSEEQLPAPNLEYFVFVPAGLPVETIDRRVDVRPYLQRKYAVMRAHHSQRQDAEQFFGFDDAFHAVDNFCVITAGAAGME